MNIEQSGTEGRLPLIGLTIDGLRQVAAECGLPSFAASQMARALYVRRVDNIEQMTDISRQGRERLASKYCIGLEAPFHKAVSRDGTVKYLFRGVGGRDIEAVAIPDGDRLTLCVSSQAGCRMGCRFCMTGRQGYHGNLTPAQIINQIMSVDDSQSLTNVVFMGMGEPLDNFDAVRASIEILTAKWGMGWSPKRITVSTVGRGDMIDRLLDETAVHVALSLHNPFADQRAELMPAEKAWPYTEILERVRRRDWRHQRRFSVEYTMWRGVNDTPRHADALARALRGIPCRVNLIRFHQIPDSPLRAVGDEAMTVFRDRLNALGLTATVRASRGEDIMAACGLLAGQQRESE